MHPSQVTGKLLDYYETHVQPNVGNQTQFNRTLINLIGEVESAMEYLPLLRHGIQCSLAGQEIMARFRAGTNPTEKEIYHFKAQLRQMDMAAKVVPEWFNLENVSSFYRLSQA